MNKYEKALTQMCRQCKTKPSNCNKAKCSRYNAFKELIEGVKILKEIYSEEFSNLEENYELNDHELKILKEVVRND